MCNQSWNKILFTWANFCFTKYTYLCEKYCMSFNKENTKERIRRLKVRGEQPIPADTDVLYILLPIPVWSAVCLSQQNCPPGDWNLYVQLYNVHAPGVILVRLQMKANVQCHCPMSLSMLWMQRRSIRTEEKAKVIADVWGAESGLGTAFFPAQNVPLF